MALVYFRLTFRHFKRKIVCLCEARQAVCRVSSVSILQSITLKFTNNNIIAFCVEWSRRRLTKLHFVKRQTTLNCLAAYGPCVQVTVYQKYRPTHACVYTCTKFPNMRVLIQNHFMYYHSIYAIFYITLYR